MAIGRIETEQDLRAFIRQEIGAGPELAREVQGKVAAIPAISAFMAALLDDVDAATARGTLGTDAAGAQRPPQSPTTNLRVVVCQVTGSSGTIAGDGVSITKHATGQYTVTFTTPFSSQPRVAAMGTQICYRNAIAAGSVRIHTFTDAGVAADATFDVIAIGPA